MKLHLSSRFHLLFFGKRWGTKRQAFLNYMVPLADWEKELLRGNRFRR